MALYFCTGSLKEEQLFKHYALNVPLYTHFTSPIRRYADIIVHRLLASSLSAYILLPKGSIDTQEHTHTLKQTAGLPAGLLQTRFQLEICPLMQKPQTRYWIDVLFVTLPLALKAPPVSICSYCGVYVTDLYLLAHTHVRFCPLHLFVQSVGLTWGYQQNKSRSRHPTVMTRRCCPRESRNSALICSLECL